MHFSKMHFSKMHFSKILQIFGGLVLGCIKTKFCKKICVRQHFSSSTRFASFCTAAISKFSQKSVWKFSNFPWKFSNILQMLQDLQNFAKFQKCQLDNLVDFEKCSKTRIFLQKSVPIQPKTGNIFPKFAKNWHRRSRRPSCRCVPCERVDGDDEVAAGLAFRRPEPRPMRGFDASFGSAWKVIDAAKILILRMAFLKFSDLNGVKASRNKRLVKVKLQHL